ncbi:hypothetical protein [Candidatus Thiosymbion oneisti]|uniref:hypothetical protein n=1 Tax=Candidatus Thiosymbion oneisti TaxID=589554 RepID=UPI00159EFC6D|nr:hypothetical protein [Candidatus Thiosymbion oneisti]
MQKNTAQRSSGLARGKQRKLGDGLGISETARKSNSQRRKRRVNPADPQGNKKLDEILKDPKKLDGKTPDQVRKELGQTPGWKEEGLGKGSHKGKGWVLREYSPQGNPTGRMVRWHPGGGHHGPNPYWRVTSPTGGKSPNIPAGKP